MYSRFALTGSRAQATWLSACPSTAFIDGESDRPRKSTLATSGRTKSNPLIQTEAAHESTQDLPKIPSVRTRYDRASCRRPRREFIAEGQDESGFGALRPPATTSRFTGRAQAPGLFFWNFVDPFGEPGFPSSLFYAAAFASPLHQRPRAHCQRIRVFGPSGFFARFTGDRETASLVILA
jgi:hypothetical protein